MREGWVSVCGEGGVCREGGVTVNVEKEGLQWVRGEGGVTVGAGLQWVRGEGWVTVGVWRRRGYSGCVEKEGLQWVCGEGGVTVGVWGRRGYSGCVEKKRLQWVCGGSGEGVKMTKVTLAMSINFIVSLCAGNPERHRGRRHTTKVSWRLWCVLVSTCHSFAVVERRRRDRINELIKMLAMIVPGCQKKDATTGNIVGVGLLCVCV